MEKIAVFPGSFDPITLGHEHIVHRALSMFDKVIVAVGENEAKSSYFSIEERLHFVKQVFQDVANVEITSYSGLTVDFCQKHGAAFMLRGLRSSSDFEYERQIALINKSLNPSVETVFLLTDNEYAFVSSSFVREILKNGGLVDQFVPEILKLKPKVK